MWKKRKKSTLRVFIMIVSPFVRKQIADVLGIKEIGLCLLEKDWQHTF